jgi:hypothetical protein
METPAADVGPEPTATGEMTTLFYKSISSSAAKMVLKNMLGWLANSESSFLMKRKH